MHLFVWKNVFCDYTCGIAFAIAPTLSEAARLAVADDEWRAEELLKHVPEIHPLDAPYGAYIYGGA